MMNHPEIDILLADAVEKGVFPGCAYAFGNKSTEFSGYVGWHDIAKTRKVDEKTVYDLASLTKVISTTSLAMRMWPDPKLVIDRRLNEFLPDYADDRICIGHLLRHDSGLPAYDWELAGQECDSEATRKRILGIQRLAESGEQTVYSCLNFILLGFVLEKVAGQPLDVSFAAMVGELGGNMRYIRPQGILNEDLSLIAPVEKVEDWRRSLLESLYGYRIVDDFTRGSVHDPLAFYLGGVSGNAGVFGSLIDVVQWAKRWIEDPEWFSPKWRDWVTVQSENSTRALGFDTKSPTDSSAGQYFSSVSFGHLGFTGTSIWIDPRSELWGVLLSNRVHPSSTNITLSQLRPQYYDQVFRILT